MKRICVCLASFVLAASLAAGQTTSYSAETANNTAACSADTSHSSYCQGAFIGMSASGVGTYHPAPWHVSDVPLRSALYPGSTTKVYAHLMPWFTICSATATTFPEWDPDANGGQGGYKTCSNNHVETGYSSNTTATVQAQMDDMLRRGFSGVVINWYGKPNTTCPGTQRCLEDGTTLKVRDNLAARCTGAQNCPMLFSLDVDSGSFKYDCTAADSQQPTCFLNRLNTHLDYANSTYFNSNAYLKVSGRPVVSFFIAESQYLSQCNTSSCSVAGTSCTSSTDCWAKLWNAVRTHIQGYSQGNPMLLFRDSPGFTHQQTDGAFAWKNHYRTNCSDPEDLLGLCSLDHFYAKARTSTLQGWGAAWKGSGVTAAWDQSDPTIPLRCGTTWLQTLAEARNAGYSSSSQLPYLQVASWNDYDEGTAMEMGIDNCWAVDASVSGSTLSWSLRVQSDEPSASTYATVDTIDHFVVWDSPDGENLTQAATLPNTATSFSLSSLSSGPHLLYVEAVGAPSIFNKMSNQVPYPAGRVVTISTPAPGQLVLSPVRVTASAASPDAVTLTQIYVDGTKRYETPGSSLDTNVTMASGNRRLTVQAYDVNGTFKTTEYIDVCALSSTSPSVTICTPQDGTSVSSPVRVLAGTTSANLVNLIQIYIDGSKVYEEHADRLDHPVTLAAGTHRLTVQAYDSTGAVFKSAVYVTVP
jgi:hypothetical protein